VALATDSLKALAKELQLAKQVLARALARKQALAKQNWLEPHLAIHFETVMRLGL